jgi:hypothetical protein
MIEYDEVWLFTSVEVLLDVADQMVTYTKLSDLHNINIYLYCLT